jgi:hypothetical protein
MTRWSLLLVAACLAVLGVASVGLAATPDRFTDSFDYDGTSSCSGFDDVYLGHLDVSGMTTFDKKGNPIRDVVQFRGWETNVRSDNPDVSITAKRSFTVIYNYASGVERNVGNVFTQTAPGQGVLFHDVGVISFDGDEVTVHGPHDLWDQGDAVFCNALLAVS